jgi:penicillin-binding protein 1A
VIAACAGVGWILSVAGTAPDIAELKPVDQGATSVVYASDGKTRLGFIQGDTLRTPVPAAAMPQNIREATVAIEDRRFFRHNGVDVEGVVRAAIKNVSSGETVQGGSTLTMQLVRNLYAGDRARSGIAGYKRKIREAKLASDLEDRHPGTRGKRWILTQYLNNVPYGTVGGQTAVGIQAASRTFFGKPASRLTLPEAALLAGLPQAPSRYNPFLNPDGAKARRAEVLDQMRRSGYITAAEERSARSAPLGVQNSAYYTKRRESYFFDYVRTELIRRYGADRVRRGGLKVYTTISLKMQQAARKAMLGRLPNPGDPSAALVSMDPKNGHIKAMASSGDYSSSKFNLAAQGRRQPGSTFKVMVLMAALRQGVDIRKTTYDSKPLNFTDPVYGKIEVNTDDKRYRGSIPVFNALVASDNTVFQQLDLDLGPEEVRQTAYDMGITSKLDAYPAEGLGGLRIGVSPLEMTRAYVTINNGGWRVKPVAITKVVFPDGEVDRSLGKTRRTKVFTDGQAHEATLAMEANAQRGTGTNAQIGCPIAGKTGTTNDYTDAWFDGYTTSLNTAVWVGYPGATVSMSNVAGYGPMFGGKAPALIWRDFMERAMKGRPCDPFPKPTESFEAKPFFGKYATTGAPGGGKDPRAEEDGNGLSETGEEDEGDEERDGDRGADRRYPPSQYESPPQPAPTPAPQPRTPPQEATPVAPTGGVGIG